MKLLNLRKLCVICSMIFAVFAMFFAMGTFVGSSCDIGSTNADADSTTNVDASKYYYNQLVRNESDLEVQFYKAIESMSDSTDSNNSLKGGKNSIDLVASGFLKQSEVDKYASSSMALLYAFGAAKDAFYLDHPEVFYVNFDKMSIRTLNKAGKNYAFLGIGRTDSYASDGDVFSTAEKVDEAIEAYEEKYSSILTQVESATTTSDKVKIVYDFVRNTISYKTELTCTPANIAYVRNPYALVTGEGVCEAYARSFKIIMDKIGIPCVSVIGMYNEYTDAQNNELKLSELHMWNYVLIDDIWYLVDTTMDSQVEEANCKYFLAGYGTTGASHIPNQVISQSNYSFRYPELCNSQYSIASSVNTNFTMKDVTVEDANYVKVTYKGMNGQRLYEQEEMFFAVTYTGDENGVWTALTNYTTKLNYNASYNTDDGLLVAVSGDFSSMRIGVTKLNATTPSIASSEIEDYSEIYENQHRVESTHKPFPINVTPKNTEVLRSGVTYDVKLVFDEMLKAEADKSVSVEVTYNTSVLLDDIAISNVVWDGKKTVTCKFTTSKKYAANTCTYQLWVKGLVSEASGQECMSAGFFVLNQTNVGCPLKWGQTYEIYGKPQLLENPSLDTTGWEVTDSDGTVTTVNQNLSNGVALVVNDTVKSDTQSTINSGISTALGTNNQTVLASKTYDVSLTLCGQQVKNLPSAKGKRVKIMLPFPDGYSGKEAGVTFKAYHYNSTTGKVEEVDCLINENGIVIFCNSFSPYTVVATQKSSADAYKKVAVLAHEGGTVDKSGADTFDNEFIQLSAGETKTITLVPNEGYVVDYVRINGSDVPKTDNQFRLSYDELNKENSIVDVYFVSSAVKQQETDDSYVSVVPTAKAPQVDIIRTIDTLNAVVSGVVGKLSYQWYMDGELLVGETGSTYQIEAENDNKIYTVEVTNSVLSSTATTMSEPYQKIQDNTVLIVLLMCIVVALVCVVLGTMLIRRKNAKNAEKITTK